MLVVRNDDRPGMIGVVGTALGEAGVNIADMHLGRTPTPGLALMVSRPRQPVPGSLIDNSGARPASSPCIPCPGTSPPLASPRS